jgi:hypothetical protein
MMPSQNSASARKNHSMSGIVPASGDVETLALEQQGAALVQHVEEISEMNADGIADVLERCGQQILNDIIEVARLRERLDKAEVKMRLGVGMANAMYNWSQRENIPADVRARMKQFVEEWDAPLSRAPTPSTAPAEASSASA